MSAPAPDVKSQAAAEITRLCAEIAHHNKRYHEDDAPEISDAAYDALVRQYDALIAEHPELAPDDSPRERVGGAPKAGFAKVNHVVPMLSLANAFSEEDVTKFDQRIRRLLGLGDKPLSYAIDPKVDGLACSLIYEQGELVTAATRGDGQTGENVTANAKTIPTIPHKLQAPYPALVEVRGEVCMDHEVFQAHNTTRMANLQPLYASPRNAAAGGLRQTGPEKTRQMGLRFIAYQIARHSGELQLETQGDIWLQLEAWGFVRNTPSLITNSLPALFEHYVKSLRERSALTFDIDGLVYKLDDLSLQKKLGAAGRTPRWAIAHKFPAEVVETVVEDIVVGIGMSGVAVPVAHLTPVEIGGVRVSCVSLHNQALLKKLDLRIGDTVLLERAGDVIPHILGVVKTKRPSTAAPYHYPKHCPSCQQELAVEATHCRCVNHQCPDRVSALLEHFASKDALDLTGIGPTTISTLEFLELVSTPADFFRLGQLSARHIELLFGKKTYAKICQMLAQRRAGVALERVIYGLGIRHVGHSTARVLARHFGSLPALLAVAPERLVEELVELPDIGETTATSIADHLSDADNRALIEELSRLLVTTVTEGGRLSGKTVVFTGSFAGTSRALLRDAALRHGAKVSDSVSPNTDYLIAGSEAGKKLTKATKLGIPVLTEEEWRSLIGEL